AVVHGVVDVEMGGETLSLDLSGQSGSCVAAAILPRGVVLHPLLNFVGVEFEGLPSALRRNLSTEVQPRTNLVEDPAGSPGNVDESSLDVSESESVSATNAAPRH